MSKNFDKLDSVHDLGKKINTSTDDYYLNPYKFKYNNSHYDNLEINDFSNCVDDSTDLDLVIKTLTSIIMSNSNSNFSNKKNYNTHNQNISIRNKNYPKLTENNNFNNILNNINIIDSEKNNNNHIDINLFKLVANNKFDELENVISNKNTNINIQDIDGDTPLHIAIFLGSIKAGELLMNAGADIFIKDKWGQTAFHRICFCLNNRDILKIVSLFYKVNKNNNSVEDKNIFNQTDYFGNTAFHLVLKYIIKNKTKLNKIQIKLIQKLKILTNLKLRNKEGYSIDDLLSNISV